MGLLQAQTGPRRESSIGELYEHQPRTRITSPPDSGELTLTGRHEPHSLIERTIPADPYTAWIQEREAQAECEREGRPQIRLVHRPRTGGREILARRL